MIVLNLSCSDGHSFEGWFGSEPDFQRQVENKLLSCPICGVLGISRLPSAPRLNLGAGRDEALEGDTGAAGLKVPAASVPSAESVHAILDAVRRAVSSSEDVGERFPEEARKIHYGESPERLIRGKASDGDRADLAEEGIQTFQIPSHLLKSGSH